ncbi:het-6-heterokaryon incompatibility [Fusarium sp. NRRL 52700]|nr:het-6-heterokaryon incompatibility [Fusarium sp. NRRL 52700]
MDVQSFTFFPYQPLKSDEQRLLLVKPGDDDLIRVELKTVKSRTSQRFWALSYVWGARENPATIHLNGQPFSITRNLYHALYQYRRHAFDGYDSDKAMLWVDAICINQNDQVEKSIQVPRMSEIYGQCERVLAWLGLVESDEEGHVSRLAQRLKHFQSPADSVGEDMSEDDRITTFMKSGRSDKSSATEVESVRDALRSIGYRPWFRRIWILQEAVLAKKQPILLCGPHELGYEIFFKTWVLMLNPSEDGQLLYSFMAENPIRFKAIELVYKKILQARSTTTTPEQDKGSVSQEKQCALDIVKLLNETTELEATVAHDRLYALIGLLDCNPLPSALQPDYTQSFEELCYKFTMFILEQTQDIRVLNLGTVGNLPAVPSWIPDLRNSWTARSNLTPSPEKCFNVSEDGRTLSMPAIIIGQCVSMCKPVAPDPDTGLVSPTDFLQFDEAIVKVAAAIRRVTRMEVMAEWLKFHLSDIYTEERLTQNPIIVQRVMMAYVCMVHNQPLSSLGTRFGTEEQLQGAYGMVVDPIFQQSMVGCSNFVLQDGTAGQLLHRDALAAVGDAICVFPGLSTLFLIRRNDGTCRIIGQASKWECIGASLPADQLESYRRSFQRAHSGEETDPELTQSLQDWAITATSSPLGGSPDILVEEILNSLSKQGEYCGSGAQPVSAAELVPVIIDRCIGSYERRPNGGERLFIGRELSLSILTELKETTLFDDFRAWSTSEHQQKRKSKDKGKQFSQADSLIRGQSSSSTLETKTTQTTIQTHSHGHNISAAIKKAKDLYCDIKDVRDELNILKSVAQYQKIVERGFASKEWTSHSFLQHMSLGTCES